MNEVIILHVTYKTKSGMAKEFIDAIAASGVDKLIRTEPGNRCYDYFFPVNEANEVLLVEKWESGDALKAHLEAAHMALLKSIKDKHVAETVIEKFSATQL